MHNRIIRLYLALSASAAFARGFTAAVYVIYLRSYDLNFFDANLTNLVFYVTLLACEIPTGAFADVFGRKASFVASCLFWALSCAVYGASSTQLGFIIAEMIGAVGMTLASGAFQAWLVDRLAHHGYSGSIIGTLYRERAYNTFTTIAGAITGAALGASFGLKTPWFVESALLAAIALAAMILMREEYFVHKRLSWRNGLKRVRETAKSAIRYGRANANIRFLIVVGLAQAFAVQAPNMQWQPFFQQLGLSPMELGLLFGGMQLALFCGAWLVIRQRIQPNKEQRALLIALIGTGIGIALSSLMPWLSAAIVMFLIHEVFRGAFQPIRDSYLNDQISSKEQRATVLSFASMANHAGGILGLLLSGALAQLFGMSVAWMTSGIVLVVAVLWVGRNGRRT